MSKKSISSYMTHEETTLGLGYWLFQLLLLPSLLHAINGMLTRPFSEAELNFTFFMMNFIAVICIFRRFLGSSGRRVAGHPVECFEAVVLGAVAYAFCGWVMNWFIHQLAPGFVNRNDAAITAMSQGGYYLMLIGTVVLVPPVEECFYRGLIFRSIYKSSHTAAYLISIAVFALIHIMGFVGKYTPLELVLSFLQYVPAGLCLAWSYAKADTIYAPILIHAAVNYYGIHTLR